MENVNEIDYEKLVVDKEDEFVRYNDDLHKYWTKDKGLNCISATTLIHRYVQPFDGEFWSRYKALEALVDKSIFTDIKKKLVDTKKFEYKYLEECSIDEESFENKRQEILKEWEKKNKDACERGTALHKFHELQALGGNVESIQRLKLGGTFETRTDNKIIPGKGVYPELLLSRISDDGKLRIAGQADLIIVDGLDVYILDFKGLPLDTPIATPNGWTTMGEIKVGDKVFDKNGKITTVVNTSKIHKNPCYKINFDNSESIICDHEHRWEISFRRAKDNYVSKVMTTEEILKHLETSKRTSYNIPKIMNPKPIDLPEIELPIDPYVFGAWLGDGSKSCGIITNVRPEFWEEISKRGYVFGSNLSGEDRAEMRTILDIRGELNKLGVLNNKFIPEIYMRSSYSQRLDLLRGLMDTDGYYHTKRERFVMNTDQEWQAKDLIKLLASLGIKSTLFDVVNSCNGKKFKGWHVCFFTDENPFLIRNQEISLTKVKDYYSYRVITSIEKVETVDTRCIEVDSPSHTFLAGHSMIVTHNTNKALDKKSYFDRKQKRSVKMQYPLNNLDDCNYMHYSMQLSLYAWMIQKINPNFNIKALTLIHLDHDGGTSFHDCEYLKVDVERMLAHYKKQIEHEEFKKSMEKIVF